MEAIIIFVILFLIVKVILDKKLTTKKRNNNQKKDNLSNYDRYTEEERKEWAKNRFKRKVPKDDLKKENINNLTESEWNQWGEKYKKNKDVEIKINEKPINENISNYDKYTEEERKEWAKNRFKRKVQKDDLNKENIYSDENFNSFSELRKANLNDYDTKEKSKPKMSNEEKGAIYEEYICEYFFKLGYQVEPRGKKKGLNDKGVDIVIKKDNIYTLIQCKNYAPTSPISEKILTNIYGQLTAFIEHNPNKLNKNNTRLFLIASNKESLNAKSLKFLNDTKNRLEYQIIEYKEGSD